MLKNSKIIICGGGTGGHLFPAMAIKTELVKNGADVMYIGSKFGIESSQLKHSKNSFFLNIKGMHRTISISNIVDNLKLPFRIFWGILKSLKLIYNFDPKLVIGTGGYSSGLPLISAVILRKKILLQEQNSYPGITTRTLSRFANIICISYKESKKYLQNNVVFSGNPIRADFIKTDKKYAKLNLNLNKNKFTIFICGGSQGSKPINNHVIKNLSFYNNLNATIIWQCGKNHYKNIKILNLDKNIFLFDFIQDISKIYSAADLIISRSGALTLTEINYFGKASILIPFPTAAGNHQYKNALFSQNAKAAIIIEQNQLIKGKLEHTINYLLSNPNRLLKMETASKAISKSDSMEIIINEIKSLLC